MSISVRVMYSRVIPVVMILMFAAPPILAQEFGRAGSATSSGMSYRTFVYPGEASIQVLVFSSGGGSGIYEVGTSISLEALLALSGTAGESVTSRERRLTTIRLYRATSPNRSLIYEERLSRLLEEPANHPDLQEGDLLEIETRSRPTFGWREGLSVVTAVASLTLAIERITRVWF